MSILSNILWLSDGGHENAERCRMICIHPEDNVVTKTISAPIKALRLEGNFLFDNPTAKDFRKALEDFGIMSNTLGDLWVMGDRGAQVICTPEVAKSINNAKFYLGDIEIYCEAIEIDQLKIPSQRVPKRINTVEASKRLDAIASAGFGISRAKIVNEIKKGRLRLNWEEISQNSKEVKVGDNLQLEGKGRVKILSLDLTKRQRWKVELLRN